jgi:type I restriction enzyme S subunit
MTSRALRTLGELVGQRVLEIGDGYRTKRSELDSAGYRIIRVADITDNRISLASPDFVDESYAQSIGRKAGRPGDVLLTTKGTVGRVAIVPSLGERVVYSPQVCYFRVLNHEVLDSRFLGFWFSSEDFLTQASHRMNNTDMAAYINLADIRSLALKLPPIAEQRAIAEVLGALDDKIAANTKMITTADALSHTTFQNAQKDGVSIALSSTADFVNGRAFTKGASGTGRVVVRIAELNSGIGGSTVFSDASVDDQYVASPGDILFAWSGSLTLHRWFRDEAIINQHIFKVLPRAGYPHWLVYELVRAKLGDFISTAADKATTMGHIQRKHLDELVQVPSLKNRQRVEPLMGALWDVMLNAERENLTLGELRDTLLPQLMSGNLRVRESIGPFDVEDFREDLE